jgi:hypothetical protein
VVGLLHGMAIALALAFLAVMVVRGRRRTAVEVPLPE